MLLVIKDTYLTLSEQYKALPLQPLALLAPLYKPDHLKIDVSDDSPAGTGVEEIYRSLYQQLP